MNEKSKHSYLIWQSLLSMMLFLSSNLDIIATRAQSSDDFDFLRLLDDQLMYRIAFKPAKDFPIELEGTGGDQNNKVVQVTSADQEQYKCLIPRVSTYVKSNFFTN